jgi:hypothetical protein
MVVVRGPGTNPDPDAPVARNGGTGRQRTRNLVAAASLVAGLLAALAAISPWWVLSTSSAGSTTEVGYYPGTVVRVVTGGGGGITSYAATGAPSVGALYASVLVATLALAVLGAAVGVQGFASLRGTWASLRARRLAGLALLAAMLLGAALVVGVPLAQPGLYRSDDPGGACLTGAPPGACSSFWGSSQSAGTTTTWGAGAGWWLSLSATVLLCLTLAFRDRAPARAEPSVLGDAHALGQR